jgi:high-affinity Fe2+/Pb2+ permease
VFFLDLCKLPVACPNLIRSLFLAHPSPSSKTPLKKMANSLFSVPIFFLVFREALEAAIIISVLLGLVKQVAYSDTSPSESITDGSSATLHQGQNQREDGDNDGPSRTPSEPEKEAASPEAVTELPVADEEAVERRRLLRKMRIQVSIWSFRSFLHEQLINGFDRSSWGLELVC